MSRGIDMIKRSLKMIIDAQHWLQPSTPPHCYLPSDTGSIFNDDIHVALLLGHLQHNFMAGVREDLTVKEANAPSTLPTPLGSKRYIKGIVQPFELKGVTWLIRSAVKNWRFGNLKKSF
jgi:hypothetical protein